MHNRALSALVATLAALALVTAPAFAGEEDDGGDDEAPEVQNLPEAGGAPAGAPRGGVETGLGGTARDDDDGGALLGGVLLLTAAGGVIATRRRSS